MRLSPRLKTIADLVTENSIVADIGTDHGYIPVYLIENNICQKVIASDINSGPLQSAKNFISSKNLLDKIDLRLGNGIETLKINEVDTCIIAGMGGMLISEILDNNKKIAKSIKRFILQPMVASDELRKYLYKNNYKIVNEKLSKEDERYYEIIVVEHGNDKIEDEIYFEIGKKLIDNKDPLLLKFIEKKLKKYELISKNIQANSSVKSKKYLEIILKIEKLKEVIKNYGS